MPEELVYLSGIGYNVREQLRELYGAIRSGCMDMEWVRRGINLDEGYPGYLEVFDEMINLGEGYET